MTEVKLSLRDVDENLTSYLYPSLYSLTQNSKLIAASFVEVTSESTANRIKIKTIANVVKSHLAEKNKHHEMCKIETMLE